MLTDGTGASEFVRELVKNYLYLAHQKEGLEPVSMLPEGCGSVRVFGEPFRSGSGWI